jgi:hypothetical protein
LMDTYRSAWTDVAIVATEFHGAAFVVDSCIISYLRQKFVSRQKFNDGVPVAKRIQRLSCTD